MCRIIEENEMTEVFKNKVILLIDLDGVCADWYGRLHSELIKIFPNDTIPTINELTGYFWEDSFNEKYHDAITKIVESEGFYNSLEPYLEALTVLKDIQETCQDWIEPFICTKPSVGYENFMCHSEKIQWVERHMGMFWAKRTILAPDKTIIHGDYLIDDHPDIQGVNPTPNWQQFLFDQPYNRDSKSGIRFSWNIWGTAKQMMRIEHSIKLLKELKETHDRH